MSKKDVPDGFKMTEIGLIPEDWDLMNFENVALSFIGGGTPSTKKPEYWDGDIEWTTSKSINGLYLMKGEKRITSKGLEESSTHLIERENLIIGTRVGVGKAAVNLVDMAISQDLTGIYINKEVCDPVFLAYQTLHPRVQRQFVSCTRGTTIRGIPREDLKKMILAIPPLYEQKKIATTLSIVQEAKEKTEAVIKALKELKKSMMKYIFTYGPVPPNDATEMELKETEIGLIPAEWRSCILGDCLELQRGKDLPIQNRSEGNYPVIGSNGVVGFHDEFICEGPGVLIGRSGSVGKVTCTSESYWPLNTTLYVRDFKNNDPKFVYYLLSRLDIKKYQSGVSVPTLNRNLLHPIAIGLPPLDVQRKISSILGLIDSATQQTQVEKEAKEELFRSLLDTLMTGRLRVNNLEVST